MKQLAVGLIRLYQLSIGPLLPPACRYHPSCSEYAREAISSHGVMLGGWLGLVRLFRCNPWHQGGYDPVPVHFKECKH